MLGGMTGEPVKLTITCVGCRATGTTSDPPPPGCVSLCPDCQPRAAEILAELHILPLPVASSTVYEDPR